MARFSLASIIRRAKPGIRRRQIIIRDIVPPAVLATDLYQAVYLPAVLPWERALPRLMAEYERTLSGITADSASDLGDILGLTDEEFQRLLLLLTPELRNWALRVESWQRGKWRGAILSATEVDLGTIIGPEGARDTVEAFIERNVALIKDVSGQAQGRISDAVFRGLTERKPAADVAKDVREAVNMGKARAKRIASDQLSKISSALAQERRREAGLSIYKFRHSGKLHPRSWHKARDGRLFAESEADVGKMINGQTVNAPIPGDDRAGVPPFCGCREQAVIDLE